jgi:hypothetical protein
MRVIKLWYNLKFQYPYARATRQKLVARPTLEGSLFERAAVIFEHNNVIFKRNDVILKHYQNPENGNAQKWRPYAQKWRRYAQTLKANAQEKFGVLRVRAALLRQIMRTFHPSAISKFLTAAGRCIKLVRNPRGGCGSSLVCEAFSQCGCSDEDHQKIPQ